MLIASAAEDGASATGGLAIAPICSALSNFLTSALWGRIEIWSQQSRLACKRKLRRCLGSDHRRVRPCQWLDGLAAAPNLWLPLKRCGRSRGLKRQRLPQYQELMAAKSIIKLPWLVTGCGPCGIVGIGAITANHPHAPVAWVDSANFGVGRLQEWSDVPGNTPVGRITAALARFPTLDFKRSVNTIIPVIRLLLIDSTIDRSQVLDPPKATRPAHSQSARPCKLLQAARCI